MAKITMEVNPCPNAISQNAGVRMACDAERSRCVTGAGTDLAGEAGPRPRSGGKAAGGGRLRIALERGKANDRVIIAITRAVSSHPNRSALGLTAHAIVGTSNKAPNLLPRLAQPMAMALRRINQLFNPVIRGSQLPKP